MLRIGVCDDDKEFLQRLVQMIHIWSDHSGIPTELYPFDNGDELISKNAAFRMDIILLDIVMPLLNGMDTARELRAQDTAVKIIFLTSSPEFALESYEVRAQDYLLKPITPQALYPILDQLYRKELQPQDGLTLKAGKVLFRVPFSQLVYVEVNQKHLYFNLTDGSVREVPGVLRQYEAQLLAREEFMRIHRSYIVNMLQVAAFAPTEVRTFSGKSLPVSRLLYPQLQKDYLALLFHGRKE